MHIMQTVATRNTNISCTSRKINGTAFARKLPSMGTPVSSQLHGKLCQLPTLQSKAGRDEEWGHGAPGKPPLPLLLWGNTCQSGRKGRKQREESRRPAELGEVRHLVEDIGQGWLLEIVLCQGLVAVENRFYKWSPGAITSIRDMTGTRGAFGKPQGTVASVHIGQVIMSICTKPQNKKHVIEALHRAKFKFPGHQKIHISKNNGRDHI
ncbi:hypothetical protein GH733_015075 [Mirounga leonina]|nr:hypothetical protein GH733_015075 [Mirounga leonina]